MGALGVPLPFDQTYRALASRQVDGQENTTPNIYSKKFHEVQRHLTLSNHGYLGYVVMTSATRWEQLPASIQKALEEAMAESTEWVRRNASRLNEENLGSIANSGLAKIHVQTEEERSAWRAAFQPVYDLFAKEIDRELVEAVQQRKRLSGHCHNGQGGLLGQSGRYRSYYRCFLLPRSLDLGRLATATAKQPLCRYGAGATSRSEPFFHRSTMLGQVVAHGLRSQGRAHPVRRPRDHVRTSRRRPKNEWDHQQQPECHPEMATKPDGSTNQNRCQSKGCALARSVNPVIDIWEPIQAYGPGQQKDGANEQKQANQHINPRLAQ